jgi:hypothetical protein
MPRDEAIGRSLFGSALVGSAAEAIKLPKPSSLRVVCASPTIVLEEVHYAGARAFPLAKPPVGVRGAGSRLRAVRASL